MKSIVPIFALPFVLASTAAFALTPAASATTTTLHGEAFKLIHVNDLAQWMQTNPSQVFVFDANGDETRSQEGMIPGAKALASASQYDTAQTLPADKNAKIVFYCGNTACMSSHDAAKRAIQAGYKNVYVMADGITGWKKSGQKVNPYKHS